MKQLLSVRIPSVCICYTVITLAMALSGVLSGASPWFPLALFGWLVACQVVDMLLCLIPFKSWLQYWLTESAVLYALSLAVFLLSGWMALRAGNVALFTLIFAAADVAVFWYFRRRQQLQAQEINDLL